jgi:hypothetical protein
MKRVVKCPFPVWEELDAFTELSNEGWDGTQADHEAKDKGSIQMWVRGTLHRVSTHYSLDCMWDYGKVMLWYYGTHTKLWEVSTEFTKRYFLLQTGFFVCVCFGPCYN